MTQPFCQIREDSKDLLVIGIQGQLKSHHQIWDFPNDHVKFKSQDGLLYCDGFLYVPNGLSHIKIIRPSKKLDHQRLCRSPSLGFATKAMACKGAGQK